MNQETEKEEDGSNNVSTRYITRSKERLHKIGGRVGRTKTTTETLTLKEEEEETLTLALDLSGIPLHTQNGQPPQWCSSSPFIAQGGKTVYKRVLQNIPSQSMGIFPLILGEVGRTVLTPTSTRTTMYLSLSLTWMCAQKHITFTLYKS